MLKVGVSQTGKPLRSRFDTILPFEYHARHNQGKPVSNTSLKSPWGNSTPEERIDTQKPLSSLPGAAETSSEAASNNSRTPLLQSGLVAILLLAFLVLSAKESGFITRGEPREALVAQSMFESGDWILPRRYGDVFATKPPLFHWAIGLSSMPFGEVTEFSSRLPSLLASVLTMALLFYFVRTRQNLRTALYTLVFLFGSVEWLRASLVARVDMVHSLGLFLALGGIYLFLGEKNSRYQRLTCVGLVIATLSKGPVGLVLPALVAFGWYLLNRVSLRTALKELGPVFLVGGALSSIWYLLALISGGKEFFQVFLDENFGRFFGEMSAGADPHSHSVWYLIATLLVGTLPWTYFGIEGVFSKIVHFIRRGTPVKKASRNILQSLTSQWNSLSKPQAFSTLVCGVVFLFYCLPESKRSVYLLSLYPFLAFLSASVLAKALKDAVRIRWFNSFISALTLAVGGGIFILSLRLLSPEFIFNSVSEQSVFRFISETAVKLVWSLSTGWFYFGLMLVSLLVLYTSSWNSRFQGSFWRYGGVINLFLLYLFAFSAVQPVYSSGLLAEKFASKIAFRVPEGRKIVSFPRYFYPLNFYLHGALYPFESETRASLKVTREGVLRSESGETFSFIVTREKDVPKLRELVPSLPEEPLLRSSQFVDKPGNYLELYHLKSISPRPVKQSALFD